MQNDSSRNTIIFVVCAVAILVLYQMFVLDPAAKNRQVERQQAVAIAQAQAVKAGVPLLPNGQLRDTYVPRAEAAAASPRLTIDSPGLTGTLALKGARIDDLFLKGYRETIKKDSPLVELFRPEGTKNAYFAEFGWTGANVPGLPTADTVWTAAPGARLTPATPVTLTYDSATGLTFTRKISVDDRYMFTVTDTVTNGGATPVQLASYGSVQRQGVPTDHAASAVVHEGAVGVLDGTLKTLKYKPWKKDGGAELSSTGGWLGITDKYWLSALIPTQNEAVKGQFRVVQGGLADVYEANFVGPVHKLAPGTAVSETQRLFAGAKTVPILQDYEKTLGIARFDQAVDWGNFWFFTRPIFTVLEFFYHHVGNVGVAILLLTIVVKLIFFPLANKSYESMSKMRKVAPQLEEIKKKHEKDPAKLQQETMALYQREKINPLMGCLPMLAQIPVFYALFKVLSVTIEMRHAPFFGWVHDLSSRDPTTFMNLFGLIPWDPATLPLIGAFLSGPLHIGIWPLVYGLSMWLSQAMNPPAPDPVQQKIFQLFPIIFTFTMSQFAVGLVIYWFWQNILTILQQYVIMHRLKVENPIDSFMERMNGKKQVTG
jgi:YidC/Oxa1 family membrane protein insertase